MGQGLVRFHGGRATIYGLEQRHKRDIRARTQTDRQTDAQDRGTDTQANTAAKQSSDINIVVSRLMQEKKFSNIKI